MSANILMNVSELAKELDISEMKLEFWLKRFSRWLPCADEKEQKLYSAETLSRLLFIAERINAGIIPSKIENDLKKEFNHTLDENIRHENLEIDSKKTVGDGLSNRESINLLESLIETIGASQERIAKAHEKRAEVEERKAKAIEKRAEAEEKKALAMNNIANALQNMKHEVWPGKEGNQIAGETAGAIALDESSCKEPYVNEDLNHHLDNLSDLIDTDDHGDHNAVAMEPHAEKTDTAESTNDNPAELNATESMDDLSALIDTDKDSDIDDLSALIDTDDSSEVGADDTAESDSISIQIDISTDSTGDDTADVSSPDDAHPAADTEDNETLDDLSMLIDDEVEQISQASDLRPSVTIEENFNQYKSEIINNIIKLKKEGLSVEETTKRFNKEGITTLSGKKRWSTRTISKIYKFIESVE